MSGSRDIHTRVTGPEIFTPGSPGSTCVLSTASPVPRVGLLVDRTRPAETHFLRGSWRGIALPREARVQVVYSVRLWVHGARPPARPSSCPHALCAELRRLASATAAPCAPRGVRDSASLPQFSQRARVQSCDPCGNTLRGRPFHHLSWPATPFFATCTPTTHTVKLTPLTPALLAPCAGVNKMHTRCPSTPTPRC